ncbi:hypothetical protein LTR36_009224 [Oleoguttula mirabilis]|uniref:Uncharacterized protein n=1 Tax=Oleoguttula mirabilis TaxID=1507867 RepID=A0AAV9J7W4_9PEZI|nr:hypothetical protein LTR36_009224 [Oleoguttula mirabilis]
MANVGASTAPIQAVKLVGASTAPIQAVKLASGDDSWPPKDPYSTQPIPADHAIFATGELSAVSALLGIPLKVTKLRPSLLRNRYKHKGGPPRYSTKPVDEFFDNAMAGKLMVCCTIDDTRTLPFATLPEWQGRIGDVLVARADETPLYPHHVNTMLSFIAKVDCSDRHDLSIEMKAKGREVTEQDMIDKLLPAAFHEYYMELRETWISEDTGSEEASWLWEPSPFTDDSKPNDPGPLGTGDDRSDRIGEDFEAGRYLLEAGHISPRTEPRGALRLRRGLEALRLAEPKVETVLNK